MSRVRELNDGFRTSMEGGRVLVTVGVEALGFTAVIDAMRLVREFSDFNADNDPHGEHDFGVIEVAGRKVFWKIDCYDLDMQYGSPDSTDPAVTTRVLTILLAEEY